MRTQGNLFSGDDEHDNWALFDDTQEYRYILSRKWENKSGCILWVMLNPSTADAKQDDPTIRRCIGFSKLFGFGSLRVCNLYALRATNPKELDAHKDPNGADNNRHIVDSVNASNMVMVAWGSNRMAGKRENEILPLLYDNIDQVFCLGLTKNGKPRHPLYVSKKDKPVEFKCPTTA